MKRPREFFLRQSAAKNHLLKFGEKAIVDWNKSAEWCENNNLNTIFKNYTSLFKKTSPPLFSGNERDEMFLNVYDDFYSKRYASALFAAFHAGCEVTTNAVEPIVSRLLQQIEILKAQAGESEALRGQVAAMEITIKELQYRLKTKANLAQIPKRKKLTQKRAAEICGVALRTIRNWEHGTFKPPHWYPGLDVTAIEMKERVKQGELQDRVAKAARKEIKNARRYREGEDREEED